MHYSISRRRLTVITGMISLGTILLVLACGTPAGIDPDGCGDDVRLSVGVGLTPTVSWTTGCAVGQLTIDSAPPEPPSREAHFVWFLDSSSDDRGRFRNRIRSPVTYGTTPDSVAVTVPPRPLVAGVSYRVSVVVYNDYEVAGVYRLDFVR